MAGGCNSLTMLRLAAYIRELWSLACVFGMIRSNHFVPMAAFATSFIMSPGRSVTIGREIGDWVLPYVSTMSRRHANKAQRFLIGNQLLRLERM